MKCIGKYLAVEGDGPWLVRGSRTRDLLGEIVWNKKWRCFELHPDDLTGWTSECLRDVADFLDQHRRPPQEKVTP